MATRQLHVGKLLNAITAPAASTPAGTSTTVGLKTFQAFVTAGSAQVNIEGSNDSTNWTVLATLDPTPGNPAGFTVEAAWAQYRANALAVTTGPLTVTCSEEVS